MTDEQEMQVLREAYSAEELILVVAYLTEQYTSRESTSITYEKAGQLMEAVLYCINEAEKAGLREQKKLTAMECYQEGYQLVLKKTRRAREKYDQILEFFCDYGNRCLRDTVTKGMPAFFLRYDARFCPQDHILTLDYPTLRHSAGLTGIDVIEQYLSDIYLEQQFLSKLDSHYVRAVLYRWHHGYAGLFFNLVQVVFRNLAGNLMAGKNPSEEGFQEGHLKKAGELMKVQEQVKKEALKEFLEKILHLILKGMYQENMEPASYGKEVSYLELDLEDFCAELKNAQKYERLDRIFVY